MAFIQGGDIAWDRWQRTLDSFFRALRIWTNTATPIWLLLMIEWLQRKPIKDDAKPVDGDIVRLPAVLRARPRATRHGAVLLNFYHPKHV